MNIFSYFEIRKSQVWSSAEHACHVTDMRRFYRLQINGGLHRDMVIGALAWRSTRYAEMDYITRSVFMFKTDYFYCILQ